MFGIMPTMPALHVLAPNHTILNDEYSHCAFSGKARRFAQMMRPFGYTVHEYANKGSMSEADVKHVIFNEQEFAAHFKTETVSPGAQANMNTLAGAITNRRIEAMLAEYAKPGDIVCHIWTAYWQVVSKFPTLVHVETGIGYPNDGIGAYRIFESYAEQHWHWARYSTPGGVIPTIMDGTTYQLDRNPALTWVVPNYYDPADWPLVAEPTGNNVVFLARFVVDKGIEMVKRVIKAWHKKHPDDDTKFVLAGMGDYAGWLAGADFTPEEAARIDRRGVVNGKDRAALCGNAKAMLLPSIFVEPFGGSAVEAAMCGTPAITPDFGAFTETIEDGVTGFRCRTADDYVAAIEKASALDRRYISERAGRLYSLERCGRLYHDIFTRLHTTVRAD